MPLFAVETLSERVADASRQEELVAFLSSLFGALALLLASVGLYGVVAYATARRTREIGLRLALGANRLGVLSMIFRESISLVWAGLAIGIPLALALARLISSRLFGVTATDPITVLAAIGVMVLTAGLAAFIPSRRASKVDPMVALRYE
jgi:ABC-type antimicrobial peptide transport system permease subunit